MKKKMKPRGRPFAKGSNPNPIGASAHDPEKRAIKRLVASEFKDVISMILESNLKGLEKIAKDPKSNALRVWLASAAIHGIKKGDVGPLMVIAEQVVGKVKQEVEHSVKNPYEHMTDTQLDAELKRLENNQPRLETPRDVTPEIGQDSEDQSP